MNACVFFIMNYILCAYAQVLTYHIVPQVARASDISNNLVLNTLEASGAKMRMNVYDVVEASGILFGQIQRTVTIFFKVMTIIFGSNRNPAKN